MLAGTPLRIGAILETSRVPAWQHRLLCSLALGESARLALVVWLRDAPLPPVRGVAARGYERLDRALFRSPRDPLEPLDASGLLAPIPQLVARARRRPDGLDLAPEDRRAIRFHALDAIVQLGGGALVASAAELARLGLWTFAHDEARRRGLLPFHAEMLDSAGITEVQLVARSTAGTRTLYRSFANANPSSLERNRSGALWKASALPERACRGFATGREPPFDGGPTADPERTPRAHAPGVLAIARHVLASSARVARNRARLRLGDRVWFIALRRRNAAAPIASDPLAGFAPLPCPADRFHADPMLIQAGDEHHLFFEDADRASGHGVISWRAIAPDGRAGPVQRVLEMETHLSYPFVFAWRGAWYMIPETSERRTVELHRATEFPLRWQLEKVLFHDVAAVDATVLAHRGRLWLFVAMSQDGGALDDELFLFHADSPHGEWRPHPMNPIVSDVRRARPAGPLFWEGETLYRPGQDCAGDYGAAFWINRVDVLDERSYRETPVRRVDPGWHPGGLCTHTYTRAGELEAMDNRIWLPRKGRDEDLAIGGGDW